MRLALLLVLVLSCINASAATGLRSVSHSEWRIEQQQVTVRIDFPAAEAVSLLGKRYELLSTDKVGRYVLDRLAVSAGSESCPATDQGYDLGKVSALSLGGDLYGFEIVFRCAGVGPLTLRNSVLMEEHPGHLDYAQVEAGGRRVPQIFTAARTAVVVSSDDPEAASAALFLPLGVKHMAGSLSRCAALLALVMLAGSQRILLLAALATGYLLSWLLAFSGLEPDVAYLEAAIGFVCVAAAAILITPLSQRRPPMLALCSVAALAIGMAVLRQPRAGLLLAGLTVLGGALLFAERVGRQTPLAVLGVLFGVVDGFVLPGDFARLRLDRVEAPTLAAFDLGSLAGAALLLILAWAVVWLVERSKLSWPRPATRDIATSLLSGFGLFWMLSPL